MRPLIDPRKGDIESDASSSQSRSLWSIAGSMLAEISLPKLIVAWFVLLGLPALLLGAMPIFASIWINATTLTLVDLSYGLVPLLLLIGLAATALLGFRRLFRLAERSFWALNSLAVQPAYALCREVLSQIAERVLPPDVTMARRAKWRAITAILSGLIICLVSIGVLLLVWPHVRFVVEFSALKDPVALVTAALANSIGIVAAYVAVAVLVWSVADATMPATGDFDGFAAPADGEPARDEQIWRVAHLSDIHVVGEKYGFRIECGRSGPRGNERLIKVLKRLDDIQAEQPLHAILVTGDITDAGLATEWAEFFDAVSQFPRVARADVSDPRQSRHQHRQSREPGAIRPADEPEQEIAQAAHPVRAQCDSGLPRSRPQPAQQAVGRDAGARARSLCRGNGDVRRYREAARLL